MSQVVLFLRKTLLFGLCFLAAYLLVLFVMTNINIGGNKLIYRASQGMVWKGGYSYDRFREFNNNDSFDILVFGSSRANRGLDPRIFEKHGYSLYNLGTDDQTPLNTDVLVRGYVKKGKCRLVIIDAYDKVFNQNPLESNSDLIQNLKDDGVALNMAVAAEDIRAINQFGVRLMLKNKLPEYKAESKLHNGFRGLNDDFHYSNDDYPYASNEVHLKAFENTLAYLKSQDIPCLIVCQPLPFAPPHQQQFVNDLKPILQKYDLKLYDFTTGSGVVAIKDFADMSHLNARGAELYSTFLIDTLISKQLSPLPRIASEN